MVLEHKQEPSHEQMFWVNHQQVKGAVRSGNDLAHLESHTEAFLSFFSFSSNRINPVWLGGAGLVRSAELAGQLIQESARRRGAHRRSVTEG